MAKDAKVKAKAKTLHGQGKSERDIAGLTGATRPTVKKWIDQWEATGFPKGFLQPKLDQIEEDSAKAAARKAGLTMETYFHGVRELIEAHNVISVGPEGQVFQHPKPAYAQIQDDPQGRKVADFLGNGCEVVPNFGARKDGLKLLQESLPGLKAKDRIDLTTNGRSLLDEVLDEA